MTLASILVAASVLLAAGALRELGGARRMAGRGDSGDLLGGLARRALLRASSPFPDSAARIARAGAPAGLTVAGLGSLRLLGCVTGALGGLALLAALPGRLGPLSFVLAAGSGALLPDLVLERIAGRRRQEVVAALPDALEVLAVGMGAGRSVRAGVSELARAGTGTLARELGITAAEIECGRPPGEAMSALRARAPGSELRVVTLTIERSARLGSPLVEDLQRMAGAMRDARRRRMAEKASRAAPKIQLVIALVLVPSVLLLIAAGLVANAGDLLAGL